MAVSSRRTFLSKAALAGTAAVAGSSMSAFKPKSDIFIHHVYFWLKNTDSKEDRAKLVEGLTKLSKVKTIKQFYIGQPAPTNRDVIERSYAISWLVFFDNKADQDSYQVDPIHLKFVEDYSSLWSKVIVYDSIEL
jgi:stress responsive alpha/beta barrel protein